MAPSGLSALISRELRSDLTRTSLRRLPAFQVEDRVPARFDVLLRQLDRADKSGDR